LRADVGEGTAGVDALSSVLRRCKPKCGAAHIVHMHFPAPNRVPE